MQNKKSIGALLFSVFCFSTVPLFLKYFTPYLDAWTVNGYRYTVVFFVMLPIVVRFIRNKKYSKQMWKVALIPAFFNFAHQILWAWSPYFIDPGLIGFLIKSTIIWSVAGSFIIFVDERYLMRSKIFWFGLTTAILGFIGLSYYGNNISLSGTFFGVVLILMSSLFMAAYGLAVKKYFNETNVIISFSIIASYTAIGIISLMFIFGEPWKAIETPISILILIIISALIGINIAQMLFYVALRHIGVTISYSVSLFSAFFTAILSYLIFDEKLTLFQWLAGTLIIIGGLITIWAKNRKETVANQT